MEQIEFDELIDDIRCATFHMNDEQAKNVIDNYLRQFPELLDVHDRNWFYENC
jgi:hypothetical protein